MGKFLLPFKEGHHSVGSFSAAGMLLSSFFLAGLISTQYSLNVLLWLFGLILFGSLVSGTRWGTVLSVMAKFEAIILAWMLLIPFIYGTHVAFTLCLSWWTLNLYWEGIERGLLIALRMITILLVFAVTLSHMTLNQFVGGLRTLHVPSAILGSLLIMLRFIPLFLEEHTQMHNAQLLRGYEHGTRWQRVRSIGSLLGTTIDRAFDRSVAVYEAMTLRGLGKGELLSGTGFRRTDVVLLVSLVGLVLSTLFVLPYLELRIL